MEIHHDKHHQAYVTNVNKAIEGTEWDNLPIEELCRKIDTVPEKIRTAVRNNGGGHLNHSLFWTIMGPGKGGEPEWYSWPKPLKKSSVVLKSLKPTLPPPEPRALAADGLGSPSKTRNWLSRALPTRTTH